MIRLAHLINPVTAKPPSDLCVAQPITFETMRRAREYSDPDISVELLAAVYPEDRTMVPEGFEVTEYLNRSVLDFEGFQVPRKLPILVDLLQSLYDHSCADWLVFTNSDIALMPGFYNAVAAIIHEGYDGFVINRRSISERWTEIHDIPRMLAEVGEAHKGYDCFVFPREMVSRFHLGTVCVGAAWVGRVFLANLVALASRFREFQDLHLTFHLGNAQSWRNPSLRDYQEHNWKEYMNVFPDLEDGRKRFSVPKWRSYLLDSGKKRQFPPFD